MFSLRYIPTVSYPRGCEQTSLGGRLAKVTWTKVQIPLPLITALLGKDIQNMHRFSIPDHQYQKVHPAASSGCGSHIKTAHGQTFLPPTRVCWLCDGANLQCTNIIFIQDITFNLYFHVWKQVKGSLWQDLSGLAELLINRNWVGR